MTDRPHRLVTESTGSDPSGQTTTRIEVTFEAQGEGCLVSVARSGFPSVDMRDFFTTEVWRGALDRIEAFLRARHG